MDSSPTPATTGRRLVREPERLAITGVPRSTWWKMTAEGTAPAPVPVSPQIRAWVFEELIAWVEARIAERETAAARSREMRRLQRGRKSAQGGAAEK